MTALHMSLTELAEHYIAIFNERDADARRDAVADIWAVDAYCCTPSAEYTGRAGIEERVTASHDKWVRDAGYVFRQLGDAEGHHGAVRLRWEMIPAAGGPSGAAGTQFLILDDNGQVRTDHQFNDS